MNVIFEKEALEQLDGWTATQCRKAGKILELLLDCTVNPKTGKGRPEALKHNLSGFWSRRIDQENRIIYHFDEDSIYVISCEGHYD